MILAGTGSGGEPMADERVFEWDEDKDQLNQRKHGINFRTAASVFLDPHLIEEPDDTADELRYNALDFVEDRLIHVTFTLRGNTCPSFLLEGPHDMKEENITRYRLDRNNPHEPDWTAFDAMTDEEVEAAALADPDAQPMTEEQLALMVRRPHVDIIRQSFGLTQEEFATKFGIPLATLKSWG